MRPLSIGASCAAVWLALGCAGTPGAPPRVVPPPSTSPAVPAEPPAAAVAAEAEAFLPEPPRGTPGAPRVCAAWVARQPGPAPASCTTLGELRAEVARAVVLNEAERDAALAALETCPAAPTGALRVLRVELAPRACGDGLVGAFEPGGTPPRPEVRDVLRGLAFASRLSRLARDAPRLEPPFDRSRFLAFLRDTLGPWVVEQAHAIHQLSLQASRLSGYARGVGAVEAGLADLRFVEIAREVPLPEELRKDRELADVYFGVLDEQLGARKDRGRDAALVGLRDLADTGVLHDVRLDEARALLSRLYGGRRVDSLDALLLPPLPAPDTTTPERLLAARLPTWTAGWILADVDPTDPSLLRAYLERGLPRAHRQRVEAAPLTLEARRWLARYWVESGRRYFRGPDFARAAELTPLALRERGEAAEEAALLDALARALSRAPTDAAALMASASWTTGFADVAPLDAVGRSKHPYAAHAAFDAAFLLQIAPPGPPDSAFFRGLEQRYRDAARALGARKLKEAQARALERAREAADTARSLEGAPPPVPGKAP